jgi:hypothetical protein
MPRACSVVLVATLVQQTLAAQVFRLDQHRPIRHILGSAGDMKVADADGAGRRGITRGVAKESEWEGIAAGAGFRVE